MCTRRKSPRSQTLRPGFNCRGGRISRGSPATCGPGADRSRHAAAPSSPARWNEPPAAATCRSSAWRSELIDAMNDLGWDVFSLDHEDGIGQFEVDFNYADMRTMSDRYVFFRM